MAINAHNPVEALLNFTQTGKLQWKKTQCVKGPFLEDSFFARNGQQEFHLTARFRPEQPVPSMNQKNNTIPARINEWDLMAIDGGEKVFHIDGYPIVLANVSANVQNGEQLLQQLFSVVYQSQTTAVGPQRNTIPEVYMDYLYTIANQLVTGQAQVHQSTMNDLGFGSGQQQAIVHITTVEAEPSLELTRNNGKQTVRLMNTPHGTVKFSQADLKDYELSELLAEIDDYLAEHHDIVQQQTFTELKPLPDELKAILEADELGMDLDELLENDSNS